MRRALISLLFVVLSGCSWQEWVSFNTEVIPLTDGIRDVVESYGGDPTRAAYAIGLADGSGLIAVDDEQFAAMPDPEFWMEHERMHIAYNRAGAPFGDRAEDHEHWANQGACLATGRQPPFTAPGGYDNCTDADVARMRWVLTERLGIDFNE